MTQIKKKNFRTLANKWLVKKGWKNRQEVLDVLLLNNLLEEERFQPQGLYEKDNDMFLFYFFDKENYFRKKDGTWVTGFDSWKHIYLEVYEILLSIPSAIVFYNEQEQEFIFRPVLELGKPDNKWRRNPEFSQDLLKLNQQGLRFASKEYRDGLRHIIDRLNRNTGKSKPMSVWNVEKFQTKLVYNKRLF